VYWDSFDGGPCEASQFALGHPATRPRPGYDAPATADPTARPHAAAGQETPFVRPHMTPETDEHGDRTNGRGRGHRPRPCLYGGSWRGTVRGHSVRIRSRDIRGVWGCHEGSPHPTHLPGDGIQRNAFFGVSSHIGLWCGDCSKWGRDTCASQQSPVLLRNGSPP